MAGEKDPKKDEPEVEKKRRLARRRKAAATAKAAEEAAPAPAAKPTAAVAAEADPKPETAAKPEAAAKPDAAAKPEPAKPAARKPAARKTSEPVAEAAEQKPAPKPRRSRANAEPEKPAAPAARPRRSARDYGDNPPMVRAHAKYVRTSARKARLVCDHIRGKSVDEARAILAHASRDVARDWSKLLESAVANAEHNHELLGDDLRIHAVKADEGPTLKRFRPRAMGRATKIRKRTSHLSITLTPKDDN